MVTILKSQTCPEVNIRLWSCIKIPPISVTNFCPEVSVDVDFQVHTLKKFSMIGWTGPNLLVDTIIKFVSGSLSGRRFSSSRIEEVFNDWLDWA